MDGFARPFGVRACPSNWEETASGRQLAVSEYWVQTEGVSAAPVRSPAEVRPNEDGEVWSSPGPIGSLRLVIYSD